MVVRKVFLLAAMLCAALVLCACAPPHESIREEDVEEAWVYDSMDAAATYHTLSQFEISELAAWFNGCTDIRLNRDFAGTVTINGISIKMKDDTGISILKSGENFEVQVGGPGRETCRTGRNSRISGRCWTRWNPRNEDAMRTMKGARAVTAGD